MTIPYEAMGVDRRPKCLEKNIPLPKAVGLVRRLETSAKLALLKS